MVGENRRKRAERFADEPPVSPGSGGREGVNEDGVVRTKQLVMTRGCVLLTIAQSQII